MLLPPLAASKLVFSWVSFSSLCIASWFVLMSAQDLKITDQDIEAQQQASVRVTRAKNSIQQYLQTKTQLIDILQLDVSHWEELQLNLDVPSYQRLLLQLRQLYSSPNDALHFRGLYVATRLRSTWSIDDYDLKQHAELKLEQYPSYLIDGYLLSIPEALEELK